MRCKLLHFAYASSEPLSLLLTSVDGQQSFDARYTLGGPPHPVIVTVRDNELY